VAHRKVHEKEIKIIVREDEIERALLRWTMPPYTTVGEKDQYERI
jgi:hypothetical protein